MFKKSKGYSKESKYMRSKILSVLCTFLIFQIGTGQTSFHRTYPPANDKKIRCISSAQMNDGNYVALEMVLDSLNGEEVSDTVVITSYKPKGDINWTKAIAADPLQGGFISALGSIIVGSNDSIYYSVITKSQDRPNKIIGSLDKGGSNGWMKAYSTDDQKADGEATSHLLANHRNNIISAHSGGTTKEFDIALSRKDYSGKNIWSKLLSAKDATGKNVAENLTHMSVEADANILLSGTLDTTNITSFLAVTDTFGVVKWSKKYTDRQVFIGFPISYDAVRLPDSTYILGGISVELDLSLNISSKGFLIKTTKNGNVDWGRKIVFGPRDFTAIKHIALDKSNNILIAGFNIDPITEKSYNFVAKMKANGDIIWKKKYPRVDATFDFGGALFGTIDKGSAFITSVIEENKQIPSFIKLDTDGRTTCEENIDQEIFVRNLFSADTLIWTSQDAGTEKNIVFNSGPFAYNVPVLILDVRPFCPKETVDWTFHAPIKGATYYKWSTGAEGATLDTLRVFETGKYSVMVTVGEKVCYMLCDTSTLERYKEPKAQIGLSIGNFCANNKQTVRAVYVPGNPSIKSITWSTGETATLSIEVPQPGTYRVTIVDQCDESVTAELVTGAFPVKITAATVTPESKAIDCFNGTASGVLKASSNANGLGLDRYQWSTGEKTDKISVNDSQNLTYSVTVTDGCGGTATASYTFEIKGDGLKKVDVVPNNARLCRDKVIELNAVTEKAGKFAYVWNTGATTAKIDVQNPGTFTVTVTDICGNKVTAQRDLAAKDFVIEKLISDLKLNAYKPADCSGINVGIYFNPDNNFSLIKSLKWSTGETTGSIMYSGDKIYAITVTDICDAEYSVSSKLEIPDISYPHVFFPDGLTKTMLDSAATVAHMLNRTFGPIYKKEYCIDDIKNYEFYIFNRWGQKVFESKDIKNEWSGEFNEKKSPADTYIWTVKYTIFGFEKKQKGDMTMIRL